MSSQTVATYLKVDAANVVEQEGAEAFPSIGDNWRLGRGTEHLQCLAIISPEVLNRSFQELATRGLH